MNFIELAEDRCGQALVRVYMPKGKACAVLFQSDYECVVARIGCAVWFLNSNGRGRHYVRAKESSTGRNVMIARLILGIDGGNVRHRDGDALNLRWDNLIHPLRRP